MSSSSVAPCSPWSSVGTMTVTGKVGSRKIWKSVNTMTLAFPGLDPISFPLLNLCPVPSGVRKQFAVFFEQLVDKYFGL